MQEIIALAGKDLKLLLRDKTGSFFVFFFPLIFAVFFGVIFSGEGGGTRTIPVALVDEDSTAASRAFADVLINSGELDILETDRLNAEDLVRRGKRTAYIVLPDSFGLRKENMFYGEPATIQIGLDPSRKAEAAMLQGLLTGHYMEGFMATFTDPKAARGQMQKGLAQIRELSGDDREQLGDLEHFLVKMDTAFADLIASDAADSSISDSGKSHKEDKWEPVKFAVSEVTLQREGPRNSFEVSFPQALIWAMIGCAAAFGISLVVERTHGTLVRLRIMPITLAQILAGKGLACFGAIVIVGLMLFGIFTTFFNVQAGSLLFFVLALIASAICFVGIMMFLSVLGKTEASAGGIGWAVLLIMAMLGGGMVPLFFMPTWIRTLSSISPVKWAVLAIEGAIWRGFSVEVMLMHCGILVGIGVILFIIGARVFRRTAQ